MSGRDCFYQIVTDSMVYDAQLGEVGAQLRGVASLRLFQFVPNPLDQTQSFLIEPSGVVGLCPFLAFNVRLGKLVLQRWASGAGAASCRG
jgi:hypothetical protein